MTAGKPVPLQFGQICSLILGCMLTLSGGLSGGLFRRLIVIRKRQPFSSIARRADDPGTLGPRRQVPGRFPALDEMQSKHDQRCQNFQSTSRGRLEWLLMTYSLFP